MNTNQKVTLWQRICSAVLALALIFSMIPDSLVSQVRALEFEKEKTLTIDSSDGSFNATFKTSDESASRSGDDYFILVPDVGLNGDTIVSNNIVNGYGTFRDNVLNGVFGNETMWTSTVGRAINPDNNSVLAPSSGVLTVTNSTGSVGTLPAFSDVLTALKGLTNAPSDGLYVNNGGTAVKKTWAELESGGIPYVAIYYSAADPATSNLALGTYLPPASTGDADLYTVDYEFRVDDDNTFEGWDSENESAANVFNYANSNPWIGTVKNIGDTQATIIDIELVLFGTEFGSVDDADNLGIEGTLFTKSGVSYAKTDTIAAGATCYLGLSISSENIASLINSLSGYAKLNYETSSGATKCAIVPVRIILPDNDGNDDVNIDISSAYYVLKAGQIDTLNLSSLRDSSISAREPYITVKNVAEEGTMYGPYKPKNDNDAGDYWFTGADFALSHVTNGSETTSAVGDLSAWFTLSTEVSNKELLDADSTETINSADDSRQLYITPTEELKSLTPGFYVETLVYKSYILSDESDDTSGEARHKTFTIFIEVLEAEYQQPTLTQKSVTGGINYSEYNVTSTNDPTFKYDHKDYGAITKVEITYTPTGGTSKTVTVTSGNWSTNPSGSTSGTGELTITKSFLDTLTDLPTASGMQATVTAYFTHPDGGTDASASAIMPVKGKFDGKVTVYVDDTASYNYGTNIYLKPNSGTAVQITSSDTATDTGTVYTATGLTAGKTYTVYIGNPSSLTNPGVATTETITLTDKEAELHFYTLEVRASTGAASVGISRSDTETSVPSVTSLKVLAERATAETLYLYASPAAGYSGAAGWTVSDAATTGGQLGTASGDGATPDKASVSSTVLCKSGTWYTGIAVATYTNWNAIIETKWNDATHGTLTSTDVTNVWLLNKTGGTDQDVTALTGHQGDGSTAFGSGTESASNMYWVSGSLTASQSFGWIRIQTSTGTYDYEINDMSKTIKNTNKTATVGISQITLTTRTSWDGGATTTAPVGIAQTNANAAANIGSDSPYSSGKNTSVTGANNASGATLNVPSGITLSANGLKTSSGSSLASIVPDTGYEIATSITYGGSAITTSNGWTYATVGGYAALTQFMVPTTDQTWVANFQPQAVDFGSDDNEAWEYGDWDEKTYKVDPSYTGETLTYSWTYVDSSGAAASANQNWVQITPAAGSTNTTGIEVKGTPNKVDSTGFYIKMTVTSSNGTTSSKTIHYTVNKANTNSTVSVSANSAPHIAGQSTDNHVTPVVQGPYYTGNTSASAAYDPNAWVTLYDGGTSSTTNAKWSKLGTADSGTTAAAILTYNPTTLATTTTSVTMTAVKPTSYATNSDDTSSVWTKYTANISISMATSVELEIGIYKDGVLENGGLHNGATVEINSTDGTNPNVTATIQNGYAVDASGNKVQVIAGNYTITVKGLSTSSNEDKYDRSMTVTVSTTNKKFDFNYYTLNLQTGANGDISYSVTGVANEHTALTGTGSMSSAVTYYTGAKYSVTATPNSGYHFDKWDSVTGTTFAGNTSTTVSPTSGLTEKTAATATFAANTVTINKYLNGVADNTTNRTITLHSYDTSSSAWTATSFTDTSVTSTVTFTVVPNGTYRIYDATGWTGLEVTVNNNDPTAVTIQYYTVKFSTTVTDGSYGSSVTTPLSDKEVISNGYTSANRNTVSLPEVQPTNSNYDFDKWDNAPNGSGSNDASSHITSGTQVVSGATWTITSNYATDVTGTSGITLTASYKKERYSLTVTVKNNDVVDTTTTVTIKDSTGTTTVATLTAANDTANSTYVFTGLTKSTTYRIYTALDSSSNYYEVTMPANSDQTATLTYVSYSYDENYPTGVTTGVSGMPAASANSVLTNGKTQATISYTAPTLPGYRFDGWAVDNASASATWTSGNYTIATSRTTDIKFYAKWTANKVQIVVNLNNNPNDTKASTVQLVPTTGTGTAISAGSGVTSITNPTGSNGTMTFEGITAGTYTIWVNSATTGKTITVNNGDDKTETLNYYTVTYISVDDATDNGHYTAGSTPAAGEVLLGGMTTGTANVNFVTLPGTAAASGTSYKPVIWKQMTDSTSGTEVSSQNGTYSPDNTTTNNATTWAITTGTIVSGTSGIFLKPTFVRDGYSLTVQVKLDNTLQTSRNRTKVSIDGGTTWTAVDASGNAVFSNLGGTVTGTITVNDGTNTYRDTKAYTMANDDKTVTLEYFTVTAATGTGASSASVTDPSLSGTTAYADGIVMKGKNATLTSAPASGYGGTVTWTLSDTTSSVSTTGTNGGTVTVNSTVTATASYKPNEIAITVYINGVLDSTTATKTVTLVDASDPSKTYTGTYDSNGKTTFTTVPDNGTTGYLIYVATSGGTAADTGVPAVKVTAGGTTSQALHYYTVKVEAPQYKASGVKTPVPAGAGSGTHGSTINVGSSFVSGTTTTSVELLTESTTGSTATLNTAYIVSTNTNLDYTFTNWEDTASGSGTFGTANNESTTYKLTTTTATGEITLTPYYNKDKGGVDVEVWVDGTLVNTTGATDTTEANVTITDGTSTWTGTTTNGKWTKSGLTVGKTYTVSSDKASGTVTSTQVTIDANGTAKLEYFTITADHDTVSATSAYVGDTSTVGTDTSKVFIKDATAYLTSTAKTGYGGAVTWTRTVGSSTTVSSNQLTVSETATLKASYKPNIITITVKLDNGTGTDADTIANTVYLTDGTNVLDTTSTGITRAVTNNVVTYSYVPYDSGKTYYVVTDETNKYPTGANHKAVVTEGGTVNVDLEYYTVNMNAPSDGTNTISGTSKIDDGSKTSVVLLLNGNTTEYSSTNPNSDKVKVSSTGVNTSYTFSNWNAPLATKTITADTASGTNTNQDRYDFFQLTAANSAVSSSNQIQVTPTYTKSGFDLTLTIQLDGTATQDIEITLKKDGTTFGTPTNTDASGNVTFHGLTGGKYTMTAIDKRTGVTVTAPVNWNGTRTWDWTSHGTDNVTEIVNYYTLTTSTGTGAAWAWVTNSSSTPTTPTAPTLTNSEVFLEDKTGNDNNTAYLYSAPSVGYGGSVTWTNTTVGGSSTITASGMKLTTTINTAQASYKPNEIVITVKKDNSPYTATDKAVTLVAKTSITGTVPTGTFNSSTGETKFTVVENGTYYIYVDGATTGYEITVDEGGTATKTLNYYTVNFGDLIASTDHGVYGDSSNTITSPGSTPASTEVLLGGIDSTTAVSGGNTKNLNFVFLTSDLIADTANSYVFSGWTQTVPTGSNGTFDTSGWTIWTINSDPGNAGVTLKPSFGKNGNTVKITVTKDTATSSGWTVTFKNTSDSTTSTHTTNASGEVTFTNVKAGTYEITVTNGSETWQGKQTITVNDDTNTVLNFFTVTTANGTGSDWAIVSHDNTAPSPTPSSNTTNSLVFLESSSTYNNSDNEAYVYSGASAGYTQSTLSWDLKQTDSPTTASTSSVSGSLLTVKDKVTVTASYSAGSISLTDGSHTLTYGDDVSSGVKLSNQPVVTGIPTGKRDYLFLQSDNVNWANSYDDTANNGLKLEVNSSDEWIVTGTATKAGTFTYKIKVKSQETGNYTDEKTITITVKPKEINSVKVEGITVPKPKNDSTAGTYPTGSLPESDRTDSSTYKGYIDNTNGNNTAKVTWSGTFDTDGKTFKYGQEYTMSVTVKPDENHVFGSSVSGTVSTTDGTLTSATATATKNGDGTVTVTYKFPAVYLIKFDANGGVTTDTANNKEPDDIEVTVPATGATVTLPEPTGYTTGKTTWSKSGYTNEEKWDLSQTAGASGAHSFGATGVSVPTGSAVDGVITYYWCWSGQDLSVTMGNLDTVYNMTQTDWTDGDSDGKVLYHGRNYTYVAPTAGATVSNKKGTVTYALNNVSTNATAVTTFLTIDSTTGKVSLSTNAPNVGTYKFTITVTDSYTEGSSPKTDTATSGEVTIEVHPIELDHAQLTALTDPAYTTPGTASVDYVTKSDDTTTWVGWTGFYADNATTPTSGLSADQITVYWEENPMATGLTFKPGMGYKATIKLKPINSNYIFVTPDSNGTDTTVGFTVGTEVAIAPVGTGSTVTVTSGWTGTVNADHTVTLVKTYGGTGISVDADFEATEWNQLTISNFVAQTNSDVKLYYLVYDAPQSFTDEDAILSAYTSGTVGTTANLIAKGDKQVEDSSGTAPWGSSIVLNSGDSGVGTIEGDHTYYLYVVAQVVADTSIKAKNEKNDTTPKHLTLTHNGYGSVSWTTTNNHATTGTNPLPADGTLSNEYTEADVKATAEISMFENGDFTATPANGNFAFANWVLNGADVSGLTTENIYNYLKDTNNNDDKLHAVFNRVILGDGFTITSSEVSGQTTFSVNWTDTTYTNITIGGVSKTDTDFDQTSDSTYGTHGASNTNKGIKYQWQESTDSGTNWTDITTGTEKTLTVTSTDTAGKLYKLTIYYTDPKNGGKETSISGQTGEQRRKLDTPQPNLAAGTAPEGGLDMTFPRISQETLSTNPVGKYEYELFPGSLTTKPTTTPTKTGTVTTVGQASYSDGWDADGTTIIPGQQYTIFVKAFADATNGAGWDDSDWGYATFTAEYRTLTEADLDVIIHDKVFNGAAQTGDVSVTLKSDKVGASLTGAIGTVTVNYADKADGENKQANKTHVNITENTTPGGLTNDGNHSYYVYITVAQGSLYKGLSEYRYTVTDPTKDIDTDWEIYQTKAKLNGTTSGTTTINTAYNVEAAIGAYVNYTYSGTNAEYNDSYNRITSHFDLTYKVTNAPAGSTLSGQTLTGTNLTAIKLDKEASATDSYIITVTAKYKAGESDQFKCDIAEPDDITFNLTTDTRTVTGIKLERYQAVNGTVGVTDVDTDITTGNHLTENRKVIYADSSWTATTDRIGFYDNSTNATSKEMSLVGLRVTVNWSAGDPDVYVIGTNDVSAFTLNVANTSVTGDLTDKKLTFVGAGSTDVTVSYGGKTSNAVEYVMTAKELTATVIGGNKIWDGNANAKDGKDENNSPVTIASSIQLDASQSWATDTAGTAGPDTVTVTATGYTYSQSDVGNNLTVTAQGVALAGSDKDFYTLKSVANGTGNITPRAITEVTITTPALYTGQTPNDVNDDVTVTAKDSLGKTSVLDTSATTIKWQQLVGSTWTNITNDTYFMTGFQYRPIVDVKADTNHYLVETRTPDNYTIDGNHDGEPTANEEYLRAKVTINNDKDSFGANNTGKFVGAPKPVGAVRPVLKFKDTYDGGSVTAGRAFEVDYRQIITVTVGDTSLDNKTFSVYLGDFIADAKNVTVDYEAVNSNATDLRGSVTLTPTVSTNVGDMAKDTVYNEANGGYTLTLPAGIANTPGQYELSLSANGTSSDGLSQINTAHYHLIIVVKEKTGDGNGGVEPELKFSDSYGNDSTIDTANPGYLPSYTRVISMVQGETISDTDYLVSLKDFGVTANDVSVQVESNTITGATVNSLPASGLTLSDGQSQEWTVNLPSTLGIGTYVLHITANGKNAAGNAGSTAHYYLIVTVTEKKVETITKPGDTIYVTVPGPTTTTTVEVTAPIVTYWISEQGITNDLTAEKMAKKGDHPSFTPKVTGLDGYEFKGWSEVDPTTLPAGEKPVLVDPLTFEINEDKTFYAYYERVDNDHKNYVIGYPDGTFRPDAQITRAEVATIVARSCLEGFEEGYDYGNPGNYSDVNLKGWYASAVAYCTMMGVFTGYKDGTFRPAQYITREELATVVARLAGIRTNNGIPFADAADVSKWARDGVYTCYAYGYINGYSDGTFRPQNDITRAETVKIFNGYLNRGVDATGLSGLTPFVLSGTASRGELDNGKQYLTWEDVPSNHWAYYEIIEASNTHDFHWPTKVENPPEDWDAAYIQEEWLARARYIITWYAGEGTASAATTREKLNATPTAPQILRTPTGKVFLGWASEPDGTVIDLTTYTVTGATTFYAVYGDKPDVYYTVSYDTGLYGTADSDTSEQVKENELPVAAPTVTADEDHIFLGWALTEDGAIENVAGYTVTANTTFYAVYAEKIKIYTVYYVTNEHGTLNGDTTEQVQAGNVPVSAPTVTPAEGYKFSGWSRSENGEIVNDAVYVITADTTFHAVYAELTKTYTVRYETNAYGTLSGDTSEQVKAGNVPVAAPVATAISGYVFKGWALSEGGAIINDAAYIVNENTTFYAVYEKKAETPKLYTHTAFADGYADGSFHASDEVTRGEVADMLARIHSDYDPNYAYDVSQFTDVSADYWAANAIGYCVRNGIFTGTTETTFEPDRKITRQEFSVLIARMAGIQTNQGLPFTDASSVNKWARDAVYTVYVNGWITGYKDGSFQPKKILNRAEAVKIICNFLGRNVTKDSIPETLKVTSWSDVARKNWAYPYIMEATNTHTYYIDSNGNEVWVSTKASGSTLEVPTNTPSTEVLYTGYVNAASGLNARSAPETGNNVVQVLPGNTQVEVLELINDWSYIRFQNTAGDTATAYVKSEYITRNL